MTRNSLTCFGVGDGLPSPDRNHASFLYRLGGTSVLVDCGEPVDARLQASGLGHDRMDGVVISHLHADHIGGLFMLLQGCWLEGRRKALPIWLPRTAIRPVRGMLEAALLFDELFQFRLQFKPLTAGKVLRVRDVRVTPFPTSHLDQIRARVRNRPPGLFVSYCFLLEAARLRIGHSADLGRPEDLDPLLEKPLDLLVCEIAHFTPERLFNYLRGRPIKRIAFVHLGRGAWRNLPKTRRLAARLLPDIPHSFPGDDDVIRL
jgi:ribonuclease BN (tRNA processing enzyme)